MRMNDMVTIDTIVFEIIGGGLLARPPPPPIVNFLKYPGSDRVKLYYKLYRNKLPPYFENFVPHYVHII